MLHKINTNKSTLSSIMITTIYAINYYHRKAVRYIYGKISFKLRKYNIIKAQKIFYNMLLFT